METKETIEFVKYQKYSVSEYKKRYAYGDREDCNRMLDEVADKLQRGEKFEKMWEGFKRMCWHDSVKRIMDDDLKKQQELYDKGWRKELQAGKEQCGNLQTNLYVIARKMLSK